MHDSKAMLSQCLVYSVTIGATSLDSNTGGDIDFQSPPRQLYFLGTFSEDCFLVSARAYGGIAVNSSIYGNKANIGIVLFYLIRNSGGINKVMYMFDIRTDIINRDLHVQAQQNKFDNSDHPIKGDSIAVYIPKVPVEGNTTVLHPLRIGIDRNATNSYKVLSPDININESGLKIANLKKKISDAINTRSFSDWQEDAEDTNSDLNVQITCISK